jgi:DnaJ-class molecular chaperone
MGKKLVVCAACKGKGKIKDEKKSGPFSTVKKTCDVCNGSGKVYQPD